MIIKIRIYMAYTKLIYHIVLRTSQGTAPIADTYERDLYMYIFGFCKKHQCLLYRIGGMSDHIHLLVATNNFMTTNRDRFPKFTSWEQGYCALTYSEADKDRVVQYIMNQKEHHRRVSARDELIALLQECGVEYDERYV